VGFFPEFLGLGINAHRDPWKLQEIVIHYSIQDPLFQNVYSEIDLDVRAVTGGKSGDICGRFVQLS
jgi:hypothetical protein